MRKSFSLLNNRVFANYFPCNYFSSFLYVTGDRARDIYSSVKPHLDFDVRIKNIEDLARNVKKRQITVDVHELLKLWDFYKMRLDFKNKLEINQTEIRSNLDRLVESKSGSNEIDALKLKLQLVRDDLKNVMQTVWDIENNVVVKTLQLPNDLHSRAPDDEIIVNTFNEPPLSGRDHLESGKHYNCLDYFNRSYYFFKNELALLEIAASQFFVDQFLNNDFVPFCNADFSRSVLIEGCTLKSDAPDLAFMLQDTEKNQKHRVYLNGGASFLPFFGFHTKHVVDRKNLPVRYVAQGKQYNPRSSSDLNGLYSVWQSTAVELFIGTSQESDITFEFDDVAEKLVQIYKSLGIHFRLVNVPANKLKPWESLRTSFQLYSPVNKEYIEVGNISLIGDFISKRLRAYYSSEEHNPEFLKVISGTIVSIPVLIANLLETSESNINIPKILKERMIFH